MRLNDMRRSSDGEVKRWCCTSPPSLLRLCTPLRKRTSRMSLRLKNVPLPSFFATLFLGGQVSLGMGTFFGNPSAPFSATLAV